MYPSPQLLSLQSAPLLPFLLTSKTSAATHLLCLRLAVLFSCSLSLGICSTCLWRSSSMLWDVLIQHKSKIVYVLPLSAVLKPRETDPRSVVLPAWIWTCHQTWKASVLRDTCRERVVKRISCEVLGPHRLLWALDWSIILFIVYQVGLLSLRFPC